MIDAPTFTPADAAVPRGAQLWRGLRANPLLTVGGVAIAVAGSSTTTRSGEVSLVTLGVTSSREFISI